MGYTFSYSDGVCKETWRCRYDWFSSCNKIRSWLFAEINDRDSEIRVKTFVWVAEHYLVHVSSTGKLCERLTAIQWIFESEIFSKIAAFFTSFTFSIACWIMCSGNKPRCSFCSTRFKFPQRTNWTLSVVKSWKEKVFQICFQSPHEHRTNHCVHCATSVTWRQWQQTIFSIGDIRIIAFK